MGAGHTDNDRSNGYHMGYWEPSDADLDEYQEFGMRYAPQEYLLFYEGRPVKSFADSWVGYTLTNASGEVLLEAERDDRGDLIGLR